MQHRSSHSVCLSSLLRHCAHHRTIRPGQQAHAQTLTLGLLPSITLQTDLILLYSRCSFIDHARNLFDQIPHPNMHSFNILFSSYAHHNLYTNTLALIPLFLQSGLHPDHYTLPSLLKACQDHPLGEQLHSWAILLGLEEYLIVGSSILDMYARCRQLGAARYLFDTMRERDIIVWNTMITGLARASLWDEALGVFRRCMLEGVGMDPRAVPSVVSACGQGRDLMRGREVHGKVIRWLLLENDAAVGNALIDMYAKCGCVGYSSKVFLSMDVRNLVTWSSMIACYGLHGKGVESVRVYEEMLLRGLKPDCVTFTSVLSSCSHSGLVDEGRVIFESMETVHGVEPRVEHYACMVDLLGRSGSIGEALGLIGQMAMEPAGSVWGALLGACALYRNVEVGEIAAQKLFKLESENPSNYVALCGIYEAAGLQDRVSAIRARMRELGMVKTPGSSWISVEGRLHVFYQGDVSHPASERIYELLNVLWRSTMESEALLRLTEEKPREDYTLRETVKGDVNQGSARHARRGVSRAEAAAQEG